MTLEEAIDRVCRVSTANPRQIRAVLEVLDDAGIVRFDPPPPRQRTLTITAIEFVNKRQAKIDLEDLTTALHYAGYDVVKRSP